MLPVALTPSFTGKSSEYGSRPSPGRRAVMWRRTTTEWRKPLGPPSQHLMHVEHDAIGVARRRCDKQVFHQPAVFLGPGLEFRHGSEIDQFRIDRLSTFQPLQQFDR